MAPATGSACPTATSVGPMVGCSPRRPEEAVAEWSWPLVTGPNATLFARSASVESRFAHAAHKHSDGPGRCRLDADGWINLRIPVNVSASALRDETYSCEEPAGTSLLTEIERAVSL